MPITEHSSHITGGVVFPHPAAHTASVYCQRRFQEVNPPRTDSLFACCREHWCNYLSVGMKAWLQPVDGAHNRTVNAALGMRPEFGELIRMGEQL